MVPNNTFPSYTHAGKLHMNIIVFHWLRKDFLCPFSSLKGTSSFVEANQSGLNDSLVDVGGLCTGWIAQTTSTSALQPLSHWTTPDCQHHDPTIPSHADMYVQPFCPSYTVVGPSPMLTFAHTPLFTNLAVSHRLMQSHCYCFRALLLFQMLISLLSGSLLDREHFQLCLASGGDPRLLLDIHSLGSAFIHHLQHCHAVPLCASSPVSLPALSSASDLASNLTRTWA